jgi:hypothetical protein
MKKVFYLVLSVVLVLGYYSCSDKYDPIGKWDDCIELSKKSVAFSNETDSVTITAKGAYWRITSVSVDTAVYIDYDNINREAEAYTIEGDGFRVEHRNAHTLFIRVDENLSNEQRIIRVSLQCGDYFDGVTVTQDAGSQIR